MLCQRRASGVVLVALLLACHPPPVAAPEPAPAAPNAATRDPDATALDLGEARDVSGADLVVDAGVPIDAEAALDAAAEDLGLAPDLGRSTDAGRTDAGDFGACSVGGVAGRCVEVALCTGGDVATPGLCPGPRNVQCCTPRGGAFMCDAMVHQSPNLGLGEEPGVGGCPAGMLRVDSFCIDRFEASLLEVRADGSTVAWSPYHWPGSGRMRAVSRRGAVPQGYIDGRAAGRACAEAGKRLCTDAEWLRACRGPSQWTYPYGDTRMPGVCNDARARHPAVELFPHDPNPFSRIQDACINQLPDSLDRTGDHAGCVTAEGAFDMMGNLHEWTADPAGTFRGGFYVDTVINGNGCLYRTTAHDTGHWDYSTGFRCCR